MTPREVYHVTKAKEEDDRRKWAHTSQICALFANAHRGKGKKAFRPVDFYPYEVESAGPDLTREDIEQLREELEFPL